MTKKEKECLLYAAEDVYFNDQDYSCLAIINNRNSLESMNFEERNNLRKWYGRFYGYNSFNSWPFDYKLSSIEKLLIEYGLVNDTREAKKREQRVMLLLLFREAKGRL